MVKDILVGAGVMHIVDFPLLPDLEASASQSVAAAVKAAPDLSFTNTLIEKTGILGQLDSPMFAGTLFAPTNKVRRDG